MKELSRNNAPADAGKPTRTTDNEWSAIDVRSAEVQEIIGRPPHWLVRLGITAFFGVLFMVLLSAWMIKYPETIQAPLKLTAINSPKTLESRISGKMTRVFVENNTQVVEGEVLAWLESTAGHGEVLRLSVQVDSMRHWLLSNRLEHFQTIQMVGFTNLGELQTGFQVFEQAWREFVSFLPGGFYSRQRQILEQELEYNRELLERLFEQKNIQQSDYELALREYEIQEQLADRDFIAPIELARAERELSARLLPLQQTESNIISNYISQTAREKELMELDRRIAEQQSVFLQAINTFKSAIDEWKTHYLLIAPFPGKLIYAGILQENQTLVAGQEVFYIQPDNTDFFGELSVSQDSFGKIRERQQVLVRFSGYPYPEFGSVTGYLDYLSEFPVRDSVFLAKVHFPDGLLTNYGRELTPRNGMRGRADIITEDMTLLERVSNNITKELR